MENLMASWELDVHGSRNYMFRKHLFVGTPRTEILSHTIQRFAIV
jgi:hypothetical protein